MARAASPPHHRAPHVHHDVAARVDAALARLRADGGRVTPARRAVVAALYGGPDHHVTAEDVARAVAHSHPEVHLSTVYRALEALERAGVVARLDLGATGAVFHLVDHEHHHLVCRSCGAVTEVADGDLDGLRRHLRARYGVELGATGQTLAGTCRSCPG
ncbi:MAG TPA: transcriptional repressor [Acidimicrobiales bacterium]|nr:transcriptional repressor [Acidimicrobiales bacterium]